MSDDDSDLLERGDILSDPRGLDGYASDKMIDRKQTRDEPTVDPELRRRYQLIEESITRVRSWTDKKRNQRAADFYARMLAEEAADSESPAKPDPATPPE